MIVIPENPKGLSGIQSLNTGAPALEAALERILPIGLYRIKNTFVSFFMFADFHAFVITLFLAL
ncbi:MAG: hypothetical protein P8175_01785 [Deltaproteobacteria bacterium]|jgi:hypothetical protein